MAVSHPTPRGWKRARDAAPFWLTFGPGRGERRIGLSCAPYLCAGMSTPIRRALGGLNVDGRRAPARAALGDDAALHRSGAGLQGRSLGAGQ